tara:strand:+ start:3998 stop:5320 length:1323 start_codon:yes stop_codon:yes gene_type:complete
MSTIKVNKIEKRTGSTLELGGPGTAVTLACGATQTGFGRTGTVDWCTTAKTSPFTSVSGKGYFVNTTSGGVTVTLPSSPSAGDIVAIQDYANTASTNNITVGRNGSKIDGNCICAKITSNGESYTLVYVDGTEGWKTVNKADKQITTTTFMVASGGTETECGDFKIHTFNSDANFVVSSLSCTSTHNELSYTVVAGGGAGANACAATNGYGGGGGAGGFRENRASNDSYGVSPLNGSTPLTATVATFPITVGGGGAGQPGPVGTGASGSTSTFSTISSAGGGGGGYGPAAGSGGSGGGAGNGSSAGAGNTPPVSPPQGNPGGSESPNSAGGGGGATVAGSNGSPGGPAGPGGAGATTSITGSPVARAGGGGGGGNCGETGGGTGGTGGGGAGGDYPANPGTNGTANTGGGGGATSAATPGPAVTAGAGGSGVVIIRYRFQ